MNLKRAVFNLIRDKNGNPVSRWNKRLDFFIVSLIILSVVAIILESFEEIKLAYGIWLNWFEAFSVGIFSTEYLLRFWTADLKYPHLSKVGARLKFMCSPMGLIDLLAILPFYLPIFFKFDLRFFRILRVFRLLRIFKLRRYSNSLDTIIRILAEKRFELVLSVLFVSVLLIFSASLMYSVEHEVQPERFPDIVSTLWWSVATLTTVGYGDVYPITGLGKLFGGFTALLGIGMLALPTAIISAAFVEAMEIQKEQKRQAQKDYSFKYCPHCGKSLKEHD
jgi:voltage-gated potassium channel